MSKFQTLAEARSAFDALELETAGLRDKVANLAGLEAQLAESRAFLSDAQTENENFRLLIVQKDGEIATLKTDKEAVSKQFSELQTSLETVKKEQKTVKQQARELVAATGGAPVEIDQSEIAKMEAGDEKDFLARMLAEKNPVRLQQMYREYNELFRRKKKK